MGDERLKTCRHCGRNRVNRPRGLCWPCYYAPGVRGHYPSTSKYAARGEVGCRPGDGDRDPCPTNAPPGTAEKLAVLTGRASSGERLFHPLDAADWCGAARGQYTPLVTDGERGAGPRRAVGLRSCSVAGATGSFTPAACASGTTSPSRVGRGRGEDFFGRGANSYG